jgi:thiazolinyl imide reductase
MDATAGFQTSYTLLDILGHALGALRPWSFAELPCLPADLRTTPDLEMPFRSLDGVLAGVPTTLRIQNQMDPSSPDNHTHIFHRITLGTASGNLTLVNTHGPVIWCPQPHMPSDSQQEAAIEASQDHRLDVQSATPIGAADAPSYREILTRVWPEGIARALLDFRKAVLTGDHSPSTDQYYLSLCQLWQDIISRLGPLTLLRREAPPIFPIEDLIKAGKTGDESWATYGKDPSEEASRPSAGANKAVNAP